MPLQYAEKHTPKPLIYISSMGAIRFAHPVGAPAQILGFFIIYLYLTQLYFMSYDFARTGLNRFFTTKISAQSRTNLVPNAPGTEFLRQGERLRTFSFSQLWGQIP